MSYAMLIDTTRCCGCRACQVACKVAFNLPAEKTSFFGKEGGFQNPAKLSAKNLCVVSYSEVTDDNGKFHWVMAKRQCMHCNEPACVAACPVTALHKTPEGPVTYDPKKCIGCRYCVWACPFGVPTADWDSLAPQIHKCTLCHDRLNAQITQTELNGKTMSPEEQKVYAASINIPACVKACPPGALKFGEREAILAEAKERIKNEPDRYVDHIYGEHEAGGTAHFYLAAVPFEQLGFRTDLGTKSYPAISTVALKAVSPAVIGMGGLLTGVYLLNKRRADVAKAETEKKE